MYIFVCKPTYIFFHNIGLYIYIVYTLFNYFDSLKQTNPTVEGEAYDTKRHKEVDTVFEENATGMTVKSHVLRGYTVFDKVIRPAEVVVSAPPSVVEEEKDEENESDSPVENGREEANKEINVEGNKEENEH